MHRADCPNAEDELPEVVSSPPPDEVVSSPPDVEMVTNHQSALVSPDVGRDVMETRDAAATVPGVEVMKTMRELKRMMMSLISAEVKETKDDDDDDNTVAWTDVIKIGVYIFLVFIMSLFNYLFSKRFMRKTRATMTSLIQDHFPAVDEQSQSSSSNTPSPS